MEVTGSFLGEGEFCFVLPLCPEHSIFVTFRKGCIERVLPHCSYLKGLVTIRLSSKLNK